MTITTIQPCFITKLFYYRAHSTTLRRAAREGSLHFQQGRFISISRLSGPGSGHERRLHQRASLGSFDGSWDYRWCYVWLNFAWFALWEVKNAVIDTDTTWEFKSKFKSLKTDANTQNIPGVVSSVSAVSFFVGAIGPIAVRCGKNCSVGKFFFIYAH